MNKKIAFLLIAFFSAFMSQAKVTLPALIADNMVIQRDSEVMMWGKSSPQSSVRITTSWNSETIVAVSDKSGNWKAYVKTPGAGGPYRIVFDDGEKTFVENVMSGEVWLCAGQSNMVMPMHGFKCQPVEGAMEYIVSAKPSRPIRICNIKRATRFTEQKTCKAEWFEHTPDAVSNASATAYFFARRLQEILDVPVGVIVTAWGGSKIEAWMSREVLEQFSSEMDLSFIDRQEKQKNPHQAPTLLYNAMLAPLKNFNIRGVIWYQGCSNRGFADLYARLQPEFVKMLRGMWGNTELPFYYTQIAPFKYSGVDGFEAALIREAQLKNLAEIPHSGMAVTMDCGDEFCIHPSKKKPVGDRLAFLALQNTYGLTGFDAAAPVYESHEIKGSKVYVTFTGTELGVGPKGHSLDGFELAGEDRKFYKAEAYVSKERTVEVKCDSVKNPVAVRYAFHNVAPVSVYNTYGIPASPFRTDNWNE